MLNTAIPVMSSKNLNQTSSVFSELNMPVTMKFRRCSVLPADAETFIALV